MLLYSPLFWPCYGLQHQCDVVTIKGLDGRITAANTSGYLQRMIEDGTIEEVYHQERHGCGGHGSG
jgi:hypothetical protein